MITTLRIKKKYIYFFGISFFLTSVLVSLLNSSTFKKVDPLKEQCAENEIRVDYKYQNNSQTSERSNIHDILLEIINDELLKISKSKKNFYFNGIKIVFNGKNCKKYYEEFFSSEEVIKNSIKLSITNFDKFLTSNDVSLKIKDYHIIYLVSSGENFIDFIDENNSRKSESALSVKNIIRFLVIIFLLNLIFYFFTSIKFKID